jgi:uncharacterized protein
LLYDNGTGVQQDYAKAVEWYTKAAEQGMPRAQFNLGSMYAGGQGVPVNFAEAYYWLALAADIWSGARQQDAVNARDMVAARLSASDLSSAQERAKKWLAGHQK